MHLVVMNGWQEETPECLQALAGALGTVVYEVRQHLIGGGPVVVASFADREAGGALAGRLRDAGFAATIFDSDEVARSAALLARRFTFGPLHFQGEAAAGQRLELPYAEVEVLLLGSQSVGGREVSTSTKRKLSVGKTLLSGGIPMTSKVKQTREVITEERLTSFTIYSKNQPPLICPKHHLDFAGLGAEKALTKEANFASLIAALRERCPTAIYDDRLLSRAGLSHLLGPAGNVEDGLEVAMAILAGTLEGASCEFGDGHES